MPGMTEWKNNTGDEGSVLYLKGELLMTVFGRERKR